MAEEKGVAVAAGEGVVWDRGAGRAVTLKLQNDDTSASVVMFEETAPVGTVTDFHLHHESDEVAYVLAGEITFKIGDQVTIGGPGTCAFMPRGMPHAWKSTGAEPGRVLFLFTPGQAGRAFEEVAKRPNRPLSDRERAEIRERAGFETVGPPPF
jgi:quercetin dioxygenase-like cupin family protein